MVKKNTISTVAITHFGVVLCVGAPSQSLSQSSSPLLALGLEYDLLWWCDRLLLCDPSVGVYRFRGLGTCGEARCELRDRFPPAYCWFCELEWFPWYWFDLDRFCAGGFGCANTASGVDWLYRGVCAAWWGVWYGVINGVWPLGVYGVFTYDDWPP